MFLPEVYGYDVDVPLSLIREVRIKRGWVRDRAIVEFLSDGRIESFELQLKKGAEFQTAIGK